MRSLSLLIGLAACGRINIDDRDLAGPPDAPGFSLDATLFADGVGAPACGSTVLLQDGFDVAGPAPAFNQFDATGLTLSESNSQWHVAFAPSVSGGNYAAYKSVTAFPVDGFCGSVEVIGVPNGEGDLYFKLGSGVEAVEFFEHNNVLELRTHQGNTVASLAILAFDPAAHRFWRIRQMGGMTFWDTSPDGTSYVAHVSTTFLTGTAVTFEIGGGAFGTVTNAGSGSLDSALATGP